MTGRLRTIAEGRLQKHHLEILIGLWLLSTVALGATRIGVAELRPLGMGLSLVYILLLLWWLVGETRSIRPNDADPLLSWPKEFRPMLAVVLAAIGIVLTMTAGVFRNGWYTVWVSTVPALAVVGWFRDEHTRRTVAVAVVITAVLIVVGSIHRPLPWAIGSAFVIGVHVVAGVALLRHTGVGAFRTVDGEFLAAVRGFGQGAVLAIPPTLLNVALAEGAGVVEITDPAGDWWLPILSVQPALTEEIWARLFLTTLFFGLLYPVSRNQSRRALAAAMVLAVVVHVLAHVPHAVTDPVSILFISLLYGIPLVLLFVTRDLEHAIGYHFLIDFVRFVVFPPF